MSSASLRRSSQVHAERRASLKLASVYPLSKADKEESQQQQPSPHIPKKPRAVDDDNNQAEEEEDAEHDDVQVREEATPSVLKPTAPAKRHHRSQAATHRYEPPLTTFNFRQENQALKAKITTLENQYEAQLELLKSQLAQVETARHLYEQNVKKQFTALEQTALEATERASKYQNQVEQLTERVSQMELGHTMPAEPEAPPSSETRLPGAPDDAEVNQLGRRPHGSPVPYKMQVKHGELKPFAWRDNRDSSASSRASPPTAPVKEYRSKTFNPRPLVVAPLPASYVAGVPPDHDLLETSPLLKPQRLPPLVSRPAPSNVLMSFMRAGDNKYTPPPKMNAKVMPVWMVQEILHGKDTSVEVSQDHTVINIPLPIDSGSEESDPAFRTVL